MTRKTQDGRLFCRAAVVALLAGVLWTTAHGAPPAPAPAAGAVPTPTFNGPRADLPGLPNFAKVSDRLYRGAQPTEEGFAELKRIGVRTVVSLRAFHSDRSDLKGTGLRYVRIPCHPWAPDDRSMRLFLRIVTDPANQPVFVHCQHGADRTGCAVAVYRMATQGWGANDALAELRAFGYHPIWCQIPAYLREFDRAPDERRVPARPPQIDVVE